MSSPASGNLVAGDVRSHFQRDTPKRKLQRHAPDQVNGRIQGCTALELVENSDARGDLLELMSLRETGVEPIVHVYQVFCAPGSIRAWIYHAEQSDRICFTDGSFRIVLCDLRSDSPTEGAIITLYAGEETPTLITIPPFVAHGVQNIGAERASFVNLPTRMYSHDEPDKFRLPYDSNVIPFTW